MPKASVNSESAAAIQTNLAAIFVSLELSQKTWVVTSLSPGDGERMSKHSVPAGEKILLPPILSALDFAEMADELTGMTPGKI
jgi:hypothetical protein